MDTKKLKPFDLEAAKHGEPLVTRDGQQVTEFHHFETKAKGSPCIAIINGTGVFFTDTGRFYSAPCEAGCDLFMAPRKVTRWVNLYSRTYLPVTNKEAWIYNTEEDARRDADETAIAIAIPIEIEE